MTKGFVHVRKYDPRTGFWKRLGQVAPIVVCLIVAWNICESVTRWTFSSRVAGAAIIEGVLEGSLISLLFVFGEWFKHRHDGNN
jgi:hypothetical protein